MVPRYFRTRMLMALALALACLVGWSQAAQAGQPALANQFIPPAALPAHARTDLAALQAAYPGEVLGIAEHPSGAAGALDLVLADGTRLPYDDKRERTPAQALDDPDMRTMLAQVYPLGAVTPATARPEPGFDPGRSRVQAFFARLYGATEGQVRAACVSVRFDNHAVMFNARQGAAAALERVARRIAQLQPAHPEFAAVLRPLGGTLAWRHIAGTSRLSVHSFGAAIDLNPHLAYWRWEKRPERATEQILAFPKEIVAAFEEEGFIWGGKWASFDVMHFEYRPEVILKARALAGQLTLP